MVGLEPLMSARTFRELYDNTLAGIGLGVLWITALAACVAGLALFPR